MTVGEGAVKICEPAAYGNLSFPLLQIFSPLTRRVNHGVN